MIVDPQGSRNGEERPDADKDAGNTPAIEIRTRNRSPEDHATTLRQQIEAMKVLGDPFKHYQVLMRKTAKSGVQGGLGIGRIAAEAETLISCEVVGEFVDVYARTPPAPEAP